MNTKLILLFLFLNGFAFSQSAKKRNQQLRSDLLMEQQKRNADYQLFLQTREAFDSVRKLTREKMRQLSDKEKVAIEFSDRFSEMALQLKELGEDPYGLIKPVRQNYIPLSMEAIRPIRQALKAIPVFEKVSDSLSLDDLELKQQNVLLLEKIDEYTAASGVNALSQNQMLNDIKQLEGYTSASDSLSHVYLMLGYEFRSKSRELRERLNYLHKKYDEEGPNGFPEAYKKVFPTALATSAPMPIDYKKDDYAEFPGGFKELSSFISKNQRCPKEFKTTASAERVVVKFIVSEQGYISDVRVREGISNCKECDDEAIRLVQSMPNWIPVKIDGVAVESNNTLIIRFEPD